MARLFPRKDAVPRLAIRNPFAVIPLKPDNVEVRRDNQGMIHLRLIPRLSRFHRTIADVLRHDCTKKIELDEYGTFFYALLDGVNTLEAIVEVMTPKLGKSRKEAESMVIVFTKKLMTMNLLHLKVPEPENERSKRQNHFSQNHPERNDLDGNGFDISSNSVRHESN